MVVLNEQAPGEGVAAVEKTTSTELEAWQVLKEVSSHKYFEGYQKVYEHSRGVVKCGMKFGVYLPPGYDRNRTEGYPVLYFLSGLTCTEDNFIVKSGMQRFASRHNLVVINPDTSPRESNHPGEHDDYDFGSAAGFYLNATQEPWSQNYHMCDYVVKELMALVSVNFNVDGSRQALSGHSMGGHGALVIGMRNPTLFKCLVAISPISNPCKGKWGIKAFSAYLGPDQETWKEWDATELARVYTGPPLSILVDQGAEDRFLEEELLTESFTNEAAANPHLNLEYRLREGYDHFYPYICTFLEEQFDYVMEKLSR